DDFNRPTDDPRVVLNRSRAADQVALDLVAAFLRQHLELSLRLDALGEHRKTQATGKPDHSTYDRDRTVAPAELRDERTVDLDAVERKRLQIRQRRIAGAEIIKRDPDSE